MYSVDIKLLKIPSYRRVGDKDVVLILIIVKSFYYVVLEKTLESPLDCKEIQPVHPKGDQPWVSIGKTDVEAKTPILWPPDGRADSLVDWRQEEKGTTEDEMVGWHHQLSGREFEQALGDGEGQGSLVCCSPWGHRVGHD